MKRIVARHTFPLRMALLVLCLAPKYRTKILTN